MKRLAVIVICCLALIHLVPSAARAAAELRGVYLELHNNVSFGALPVLQDGDWRRLFRDLKQLGINAIFPSVVSAKGAIYPRAVVGSRQKAPDLFSAVKSLLGDGDDAPDLLKTMLAAAHAEGLEVHPLTVEWYNAPPGTDSDLLVHTAAGSTTNTLCPSVQANRDLMRAMILELVARYDIEGVQYDYMRFPAGGYCYCRHCRQRFEATTGMKVADWPADVVKGGRREAEYQEYLYGIVSSFVKALYPQIKKLKPQVVVSAAVWCRESGSRVPDVWQDWGEWVRSGWLDFIVPMNYGGTSYIIENYERFARNEAKQVAGRMPLVFGLGGVADTPKGVARAVKLGRELGGAGYILYTLTRATFQEHLPYLESTVWSEPALVPRFGRK